jgi:hypothetical protein
MDWHGGWMGTFGAAERLCRPEQKASHTTAEEACCYFRILDLGSHGSDYKEYYLL